MPKYVMYMYCPPYVICDMCKLYYTWYGDFFTGMLSTVLHNGILHKMERMLRISYISFLKQK